MKNSGNFIFILIVGAVLLDRNICTGSKILALSFISTKSHKLTYMPLIEELGKRGHNVTLLTPLASTKQLKNVREILTLDGEDMEKSFVRDKNLDLYKMKEENRQLNPFSMLEFFDGICRDTYDLPHVRALLEESFDLIFLQPMMNDCALGLVHRLNTSLVLFSPVSVPNFLAERAGVHFPSAVVPNVLLGMNSEMNFYERFVNYGFEMMIRATIKLYYQRKVEQIYREKLGEDIPGVDEILGNTSLILSNGHFSLQKHKPLPPDVVEVGGLHSRPAKPIPQDLEDFIQKGKDGFIYFSMGSAIKGDQMPESKRKIFLSAFSKLKQQVLWKWESETMPDLPKNVKLSKWLPQQDLLGHKSIKMFITHCGGGSTEESIFHGVPLLGFPMFGDQNLNANLAKEHGIIIDLDWNKFTEEELLKTINEILNNPKYLDNAKKVSTLFKDQPELPLTRAVYWVEYVLRHKGATHLRSAGRKLNYFQYHSYDVILAYVAIIAVVLYIIYAIIKFLFCFALRLVSGKKSGLSSKKTN